MPELKNTRRLMRAADERVRNFLAPQEEKLDKQRRLLQKTALAALRYVDAQRNLKNAASTFLTSAPFYTTQGSLAKIIGVSLSELSHVLHTQSGANMDTDNAPLNKESDSDDGTTGDDISKDSSQPGGENNPGSDSDSPDGGGENGASPSNPEENGAEEEDHPETGF